MKTLQSSSRGRGGRGRGRGRGDVRFASRFTDPRFQLTTGHGRGGGRGRGNNYNYNNNNNNHHTAALKDPRFAKRLNEMGIVPNEPEDDDDEEDEDDEEAISDSENSHISENAGEMELEEGEAEELDDDVAAWSASDVEFIEPRYRVAIVNCSWDHIRAVDLYAILFYALPLGGQLKDVAIYMSDFGRRMIEHERIYGPDLWVKKDDKDNNGQKTSDLADKDNNNSSGNNIIVNNDDDYQNGDTEEDPIDEDDDPWVDDNAAMLQEKGEDGELFSQGKHRKYERDRMKYYYAIATFDSAETAEYVYKQLDGMDIEASGVVLDLRYVDDDETFENPVNKADSMPANYKPLAAFKAAALSQSRFRISWDQDDVFRYRSIRDSFTGETAEDDLAAYIAPPESSDEDEGDYDGIKSNKKKKSSSQEKLRIRKKYAALLEEIGGIPEDYPVSDEEEKDNNNNNKDDSSDDDDDDDDSLNRFSDVEMDDSDDEEGVEGDMIGDMEATLDLDAGTKAAQLQREAQIKKMMKSGDLGSKAELKYKLRRKEMRKAKKEMIQEEREAEVTKMQEEREKRRQTLREALGTDDTGATHLSGKEKRKLHAKVVKQRVAAEREAKKKMRASNTLGVAREVREAQRREAAEVAASSIDPRFQNKLLTDPRFHLDVAQKDKRTKSELVDLAATIVNARQAKRGQQEQKESSTEGAMEYFLQRPEKRAKKEKNLK